MCCEKSGVSWVQGVGGKKEISELCLCGDFFIVSLFSWVSKLCVMVTRGGKVQTNASEDPYKLNCDLKRFAG